MREHEELLAAASTGIREYLRTTRGANLFGANVSVTISSHNDRPQVEVHSKGSTYVLTVFSF